MRILFLVMTVLCLSMAPVNAASECEKRGGYCGWACYNIIDTPLKNHPRGCGRKYCCAYT
ncbi:hypothetical protein GDO86_018206 [Hymenochirus boettgeri]|uniref:Uncharacterized protein n=1 Tax=Hymenochirus boettgeri TaxID=247094 RepID=A0A8T2IEE8_9PIPI|nr:hypothetical protein GDO86_018206 [Hymenochirus boettgeri]